MKIIYSLPRIFTPVGTASQTTASKKIRNGPIPKISDDDAKSLIIDCLLGMRQRDAAKKYGISQSQACNLVLGYSRTHLLISAQKDIKKLGK